MAPVPREEARGPAAFVQLSRLVRSLSASLADVQALWAGKLQLSVPQWSILVVLSDVDNGLGMPVKSIAELLRVERPFVTAQCKTLSDEGLLQKRKSRTDKRVVYVSLSPKGRKHLDQLAETRAAVDDAIKRAFGEVGTSRAIELLQDLDNCLLRCHLRLQLEE